MSIRVNREGEIFRLSGGIIGADSRTVFDLSIRKNVWVVAVTFEPVLCIHFQPEAFISTTLFNITQL